MATPLTPRIEHGTPFLLGGIRRRFSFTEATAGIPKLWEEFVSLLPLPGQVGTVTYGAGCDSNMDEQWMEYMAAVEVADLAALPVGTGKMRVPAAKYAVFTHEGHTSGIQALWENICSDWMPNAGVAMAETPTFERYGADFDAASNTGIVEIWIPIE